MAQTRIVNTLFDSNFPVHKIEFNTVLKSKSKGMKRRIELFAFLFHIKKWWVLK